MSAVGAATWRDVQGQTRRLALGEQIVALVCDLCDRDLVYVRIRELRVVEWASKFFDCDCGDRQRFTSENAHRIIDGILGSGRSGLASCRTVEDVRLEVWGEAE